MPETLKPCPFCGAQPQVMAEGNPASGQARVSCINPDCLVLPSVGRDYFTTADAIAAWNRRAP